MRTLLCSKAIQVTIEPDGPVIVIGEKINPTGRKKLASALRENNLSYVVELAKQQVSAGADVLDVNVGVPGIDDEKLLPLVVKLVSESVEVPLCIDTPNPLALSAALKVVSGKPLVNSVSGEKKSLENVLPLVREHGTAVIGLTMDDDGIPETAEGRLAVAGKIIERASQMGIPAEDIIIDPLVLTVGADQKAGTVTLKTVHLVRKEFGVNINLGASNVSFGLPDRHTLNQAFLALAIGQGASCVITDPAKLTAIIRAVDLLLGRDLYAKRFVTYFRQHSTQPV
jgi:5-methyltetrahydrofolate--homocysteine methyltransferase